MRLRGFLLTLLLPAVFLGGGSWAQRPEITTRVANAEGKPGLLPRVFFLPKISREVGLLFPSWVVVCCLHCHSFFGTFEGRVVFAEESDVGLERSA